MGSGTGLGCAASAYLVGCFPSGYVLVRATTGQDVRAIGSGSTGARNVGRVLGASGFLATTLLDIFKGVLAVGGARWAGCGRTAVAGAVVAVVVGHIWPAPLRFRGGKGVATAFGALLGLDLTAAGVLVACFAATWALFRRSLPAALTAFALAPVVVWAVGIGLSTAATLAAVAAVVVFAHRENLRAELGGRASNESEVSDGS